MKKIIILMCMVFVLTSCGNSEEKENTSNTNTGSINEVVKKKEVFTDFSSNRVKNIVKSLSIEDKKIVNRFKDAQDKGDKGEIVKIKKEIGKLTKKNKKELSTLKEGIDDEKIKELKNSIKNLTRLHLGY